MDYVGYSMNYVGCAIDYLGCAMNYVGCAIDYLGCAMNYVGGFIDGLYLYSLSILLIYESIEFIWFSPF